MAESETVKEKVGFLESEAGRKSSSRLNIIVCAAICVLAAVVEGGCKVYAVIKDKPPVESDWSAIAMLVGALLLGNGVVKAAQKLNFTKPSNDKEDVQ